MKKDYLSRDEVKTKCLALGGTYKVLASLSGFCMSYICEVFNNKKDGSIQFWDKMLTLLECQLSPTNKAFQIVYLINEDYLKQALIKEHFLPNYKKHIQKEKDL